MATVTSSSIILQPLSTLSGDYPSSTDGSNGFTTVTVNYGDTVVVPLRSGSTGTAAGTSNYGNTPNGNTGTGGTFVSPSTSFSSSNQTINVTISNIQYDGLISFWCGPSDGGSSVGWRGRVQVNVNLDTSINLNSSSVSINSADTSYANGLTNGGAGTIYYVLNVNNYANGSNINSLFTGSDSRYIARTFTAATSKPFSTDGVTSTITNDLPTSTSKTFYVYAANLLGQNSQYLGTSYAVSVAVTPPNVSASKGIITNGFGLYSNPTGTTSGTVTYQWSTTGGGPNSKSSFSTGYTSNQDLGVGTEWVGTTWTCQARATTNGSTFVYSGTSSTTLPTYSVTAPTSIQEGQSGSFTVTSTNGLGPIYWEVTTASGGDFSTSTGQVGSGSASSGTFIVTPSTDGDSGSETATVKLYINNTFNSLNYIYATDTFTITDPPATPTADTISGVTWSATNTANSNPTISWSGGSNGTVAAIGSTTNSLPSSSNSYWVTDTNGTSPTIITVDSNGNSFVRGTTYYFWVRRSASVVSSSFSSTAPYIALSDTTITIDTPTDKSATDLNLVSGVYEIPESYGTTSADIIDIPFSNGGTYAQYRVLNDTTSQWVSTASVGGSGTFELVPTQTGDLPTAGNTYVYSFSGRRPPTTGGDGIWETVNSGATISIKRLSAVTYSVSASPTSINEGQSTTYTVTYSNIPSARTVNYAITGITSDDLSSGNLSGSFSISPGSGTATTSITLANDNLTDGSETATLTLASTDSTGASTGTPSASVTIADTSTAGSSGSGDDLQSGLTPGAYGLQIKNIAGTTTIIDDVSRIGTFLATATISFTSGTTPQSAFAGFDCSSSSVTGIFINNWTGSAWLSPSITRSSNGISVARNPSTSNAADGSCVLYLIRY